MTLKLAAAMVAAITLTLVAGLHDPASAGSLDGFTAGGSGSTYGLGHQSGVAGLSGTGRSGALGTRSGAGYGSSGHRSDLGGHQGSGWYQRGFGGNANPGWDYNFGPRLGGPGR